MVRTVDLPPSSTRQRILRLISKPCGPSRAVDPAEATSAGEIEVYQPDQKQQMAAGAALAAKRGKRPKSSLKGASKQMEKSMSEKQLKDFAKTKRKKVPSKKR